MTDETMRITCPSCGTPGKVRTSDVGKAVICQNCKQRIAISHPGSNEPAIIDTSQPAAANVEPRQSFSPPPVAAAFALQRDDSPPLIACPQCGQHMTFAADLAGRRVTCAHCRRQFTMPGVGQPAATLLPRPAGVPAAAHASRPRDPSFFETICWLLDLRFERYLTPWIIRISWILVLLFATFMIASWALRTVTGGFAADSISDVSGRMGARPTRAPTPARPEVVTAIKLADAAMAIIGVPLAVLYSRVFCECLIVIFHVANSLKTIEENTRKP